MREKLRYGLYRIRLFLLGGDIDMMALLLAQRIILGKLTFEQVPGSLKQQVFEHLKDSGVEHLAGEYQA